MRNGYVTSKDPPAKVWLRAAVLGSIWASSEIILGSFLHNLHIPLRSMILAFIGVMLMVAVGKQWGVKGLFWRAGLICALMKSVSPSGVILSPMIAIFVQGCMMEISVRLAGRNLAAYLLGGTLAVCWNLLQYLGYHILIYGFNIVDIYKKLYDISAEVVSLPKEKYWLPVYVSLAMHVVFGVIAAVSGYLLSGNKGERLPLNRKMSPGQAKKLVEAQAELKVRSVFLLIINLLLFSGYFIVDGILDFPWDLAYAAPVLLFWFIWYRRSMRIVKKPAFWIMFFLTTMISSAVIDMARKGIFTIDLNGLWIGLSLNIRALTLVTGLMAIGYELASRQLRDKLIKSRVRNLFMGMEAASCILPGIIAGLPSAKQTLLHPRAVFAGQLARTARWLAELESRYEIHRNVVLITGGIHSGKTGLIKLCIPLLDNAGYKTGGFICPAVFEHEQRAGYDICDISANIRLLLSRKDLKSDDQIGEYGFSQEGLDLGYSLLDPETAGKADMIIVDEVGPWELSGSGWAKCLPHLLSMKDKLLIWIVREQILDSVFGKWNITDPLVVHTGMEDPAAVTALMIQKFHSLSGAPAEDDPKQSAR
jgi:nucleoside-triphosphatase THEP1